MKQHRMSQPADLVALVVAALICICPSSLHAQPTAQDISVTSFASGIPNPHALCFDPNGVLYTGQTDLESGQGYVHRVNPGVASYRTYGKAEIPDPRALAWDNTGSISGTAGSLLVAGSDTLYAIHPNENVVPVFTGQGFISALTFDKTNRLLIMDELQGVRVTEGGPPALLFTWGLRLYAIAVTQQNRIYSAIDYGALIVHDSTGALLQDSLITGLGDEWELTGGPGGAWGFDVYTILNDSLVRVSADGAVVHLRDGFRGCTGLIFGPGDALYAAVAEEGLIFKITLSSGDCNANGRPDFQDIAKGTSSDCNANRMPDECEPDTDGDGVIDGCDLCPHDIFKREPGTCGCGEVEFDTDGDGFFDCADNCPASPNPFQEDANGDGIGDACQLPAPFGCGSGSCGAGATSAMLLAIPYVMVFRTRRQRDRASSSF